MKFQFHVYNKSFGNKIVEQKMNKLEDIEIHIGV